MGTCSRTEGGDSTPRRGGYPIIRLGTLVAGVALIGGMRAVPNGHSAVSAIAEERIAYVSCLETVDANEVVTETNCEVRTVRPDGTGMVRVGDEPERFDYEPTWSPDGTKLAFTSCILAESARCAVKTVSPDGSHEREVTAGGPSFQALSPAWSPDGNELAFLGCEKSNCDIYVVGSDGTHQRSLGLSEWKLYQGPNWAPAKRILFTAKHDEEYAVFTVLPDGTDMTRIKAYDGGFPRDPAWAPDGARIAFVDRSASDGWTRDIYVARYDGSNVESITNSPAVPPGSFSLWDYLDPVWSPDGERILFVVSELGRHDVYVIDADGSNKFNVGGPPGDWYDARDPSWSPSGNQIALSFRRENNEDIFVIGANGEGIRRITTDERVDRGPKWSPSSAPVDVLLSPAVTRPEAGANGQVAFLSTRDGARELYISDADGRNATRLTTLGANSFAWSPEGTQLAFLRTAREAQPGAAGVDLYVIASDGTNETQLTNLPGRVSALAWSASGDRIVYVSDNKKAYTVTSNGSGTLELTANRFLASDYYPPSWSPDGRFLAVASDEPDHGDLWIVSVDGSSQTNVTQGNLGRVIKASWSPHGRQLAVATFDDDMFQLWVMNPDGSDAVLLATTPPRRPEPGDPGFEWSPDGKRLHLRLESGLLVIGPDGSAPIKIAVTDGPYSGAVWAPDSDRIAFEAAGDIWAAKADGSEVFRLTHDGVIDSHPSWSADGEFVMFSSRHPRAEVFVVSWDGARLTNVSHDPALDSAPAWKPSKDGKPADLLPFHLTLPQIARR